MHLDKLILIKPGFVDPDYPDSLFFCWHCALMEGVLVSFPGLAQKLDVIHVEWARPRQRVVELIGPDNQSLPVLILADAAHTSLATGVWKGTYFVEGKDAILAALSVKHGIPLPHP